MRTAEQLRKDARKAFLHAVTAITGKYSQAIQTRRIDDAIDAIRTSVLKALLDSLPTKFQDQCHDQP